MLQVPMDEGGGGSSPESVQSHQGDGTNGDVEMLASGAVEEEGDVQGEEEVNDDDDYDESEEDDESLESEENQDEGGGGSSLESVHSHEGDGANEDAEMLSDGAVEDDDDDDDDDYYYESEEDDESAGSEGSYHDVDEVNVENIRNDGNNDDAGNQDDLGTDLEAEFEEEGPERTLFQGFRNTAGMRAPLEHKEELRAIDYLLVTLAEAVRHRHTYVNIIDRLKNIKKSFVNINIPTTKKALWKILGRDKSNLTYRLYCALCKEKVGNGTKPTRACVCGRCGPGLPETDVYFYDSVKYKELLLDGNFLSNPHNISLQLWTDGLKLTKSSSATTYPVLLQVNELSPHARKKHTLLAGIWVANEHPLMSILLEPIVRELNYLNDVGVTWRPDGGEEVTTRVLTTIFTADSVARPAVLRMKQYNGVYGCTRCKSPGEQLGSRRVYPPGQFELRTDQSIRDDSLRVAETGREVNGVKGSSALIELEGFDLVACVVYDIYHGLYLGIMKQLFTMWMEDVGKEWHIGNPINRARIDDRLLKIKTPTRISRRPRSIKDFKQWKASEWRNWLVYYALPCLDGVLPRRYHSHLVLFARVTHILNNSFISDADLDTADALVAEFVTNFERLYGREKMSFNLHLLTHITESVRNWGPAWVYSTYPFEAINRKIMDSISSPYRKADQIITRFFLSKFISNAPDAIVVARQTVEEINRLLKKSENNIPQGMPEAHYFAGVGNGKVHTSLEEERTLIEAAGKEIAGGTDITVYEKAVIHGVVYQIFDNRSRKYCNHFAYCQSGFWCISELLSYVNDNGTVYGFMGKKVRNIRDAYGSNYMRFVQESDEVAFIPYEYTSLHQG